MLTKGLLGLSLSAILALGAPPSAQPDTKDRWLTTKAKLALLTTDGVSATAVHVDTADGQVTIHGKVRTAQEKAKAEEVIRKLDGVKDVKNLLQVVSEADKEAVNASDESIEDSIEAVLATDQALEHVKVASVNKGAVVLAGKAPDLDSKLKAVEFALACPGVRRVAAEIKVEGQ